MCSSSFACVVTFVLEHWIVHLPCMHLLSHITDSEMGSCYLMHLQLHVMLVTRNSLLDVFWNPSSIGRHFRLALSKSTFFLIFDSAKSKHALSHATQFNIGDWCLFRSLKVQRNFHKFENPDFASPSQCTRRLRYIIRGYLESLSSALRDFALKNWNQFVSARQWDLNSLPKDEKSHDKKTCRKSTTHYLSSNLHCCTEERLKYVTIWQSGKRLWRLSTPMRFQHTLCSREVQKENEA